MNKKQRKTAIGALEYAILQDGPAHNRECQDCKDSANRAATRLVALMEEYLEATEP